jgi:hypothetical protein
MEFTGILFCLFQECFVRVLAGIPDENPLFLLPGIDRMADIDKDNFFDP